MRFSAVNPRGIHNRAVTYLGSYQMNYKVIDIKCCDGTANIKFHVENSSTIQSATRPPVLGYAAWWQRYIGSRLNDWFSEGAMSSKSQTFDWTESLYFKPNKDCKKQ